MKDHYIQIITIKKKRQMPKQTFKKQRHSSLIDPPFTQRTAYFKQEYEADPYRTLPSRTTLKTIIQNQNIPLHNKYTNQNQCFKNIINEKLINSKTAMKKNSLKKIVNTYFKQSGRGQNLSDCQSLQKKIENIIDSKIKKMIESCVQRHLSKFLDEQKEYLRTVYSSNQKQINIKLSKVEKGYDDILQTYDNFLNIVQKIKDKSLKTEKYTKKIQFQNTVQKTQNQIVQVQGRLNRIANQLQALKTSERNLNAQHQKIKPLIQKYQGQEFSLQELRLLVNTYNQNFMQIDQKLQQIYSYFT